VVTKIADQTAVATSIVQPAPSGQGIRSTGEIGNNGGDALPLVMPNRALGMVKLEAVVDQRICAFARVVTVVVDLGEVEPGIDDEGVAASGTAC
jgi:hypothetical protein